MGKTINDLTSLTDQCVKCGLCLPHCPTYNIARQENESPRGRISIIQGIAAGQVDANDAKPYLDHCLECRRCEAVCPAHVEYGHIMDTAKASLLRTDSQASLKKLWPLFLRPTRITALSKIYYLADKLGVIRLLRILFKGQQHNLARLIRTAPPARLPGSRPTPDKTSTPIYLFTGCMGNALDAKTVDDAVAVLTKLGYEVLIPSEQACCGALATHNGEPELAASALAKNADAFNRHPDAPIVMLASGCHAQMLDQSVELKERVTDIASLLLLHRDQLTSQLQSYAQTVAVQTPCTERNVTKKQSATLALIGLIPDINIVTPDDNDQCCGSAGSYFITQPDISDTLLTSKVQHLTAKQPAIITSSNIGCSLHIRRGLRENNFAAPVVHPVTLINQQLR